MIFDAGGGPGRSKLIFEHLSNEQDEMFKRTIYQESEFQKKVKDQEKRQILITEDIINIRINISREDYPQVSADFDISFRKSSSQQAWDKLKKDICKKLNLESIYLVMEKSDKSPVIRILSLKNNGEYIVRQRESSAIVEVINSGITPYETSWEIADEINILKKDLDFEQRTMPDVEKRISKLVSRSMTRDLQLDISTKILAMKKPEELLFIFPEFYNSFIENENIDFDPNDKSLIKKTLIDKFDKKIDIVTVHRMMLERLSKLTSIGMGKGVVKSCLAYIIELIEEFRTEVDIVSMGLKLITELIKYLKDKRDMILNLVLDCVEAYAPPPLPTRPRNPKRLEVNNPEDDEMLIIKNSLDKNGKKSLEQTHLTRYSDHYVDDIPKTSNNMHMKSMKEDIEGNKALDNKVVKATKASIKDIQESNQMTRESSVKDDLLSQSNLEGESEKENIQEESTKLESLILVRTRGRMDHDSLKKAYQNAFDKKEQMVKSNPEELLSQSRSKSNKMKFKIKPKNKDRVEKELIKKDWSGTQGEIGKKPDPKKPTEKFKLTRKHIEEMMQKEEEGDQFEDAGKKKSETEAFEMKSKTGNVDAQSDAGKDEDPGKDLKVDEVQKQSKAVVTLPGIQEPSTSQGDNEIKVDLDKHTGFQQRLTELPSIFPDSSKAKNEVRKSKKVSVAIIPLKEVPCAIFRGLTGRLKQSIAFTQSFATLYKFVAFSYANRELCFSLGLLEEISEIALVCQGYPRILEYIIWTIDKLYLDGFGDPENDYNDLQSNDYTMQVTESYVSSRVNDEDGKDLEDDSLEGKIFETVSEVSLPSVYVDGEVSLISNNTHQPFLGVGNDSIHELDEENLNENSQIESLKKNEENQRDTKSQLNSLRALGAPEKKEGGANKSKPALMYKSRQKNPEIVESIGLYEFEARYVSRPDDSIILAVSMISSHHEIGELDKEKACRWLDIWDDGSRNYKLLVRKGNNMAGL